MANLSELKAELEPFRNTLVLEYFNVVRLVDVIESKDDYYWVYDGDKGLILSSCVGGWFPLKGFIRQEDYDRLVRVWNLNHDEKAN